MLCGDRLRHGIITERRELRMRIMEGANAAFVPHMQPTCSLWTSEPPGHAIVRGLCACVCASLPLLQRRSTLLA